MPLLRGTRESLVGGCRPYSQILGSVAAGSTFAHLANGVIAWTQTTLSSSGSITLEFRKQDSTNYWYSFVSPTGAFGLIETVAGADTTRANVAGVVSAGHRIAIICDATTIRGYSNNVLRFTYSSASNFATATSGRLNGLGTGGVVSDLKTWHLSCRSMEGV